MSCYLYDSKIPVYYSFHVKELAEKNRILSFKKKG